MNAGHGPCPICGLTGCYREACGEEHAIRQEAARVPVCPTCRRLSEPSSLDRMGLVLAREALRYLEHQGALGWPAGTADGDLEAMARSFLEAYRGRFNGDAG